MGLKSLIHRQELLAKMPEYEMTLPGEPLIYSVKYSLGARRSSVQFLRSKRWNVMLRCCFRAQLYQHVPVVILVRFFCTPPDYVEISPQDLKSDRVPATYCYELCDYTLSFIEMLHRVLIGSYRQLVKIDVEKYYSAEPRTVFKFMTWPRYVSLYKAEDPFYADSKGLRSTRGKRRVQPERSGDEEAKRLCTKPAK